jgi:hypothetical protein
MQRLSVSSSLTQDLAKRLGLKFKNLTAEQLYSLVRERKVTYDQIKDVEPSKFKDLEYTMRLIFNHDDDIAMPHNHSPKILQASHAPATSSRGQVLTITPKPIRGSGRDLS